MTDPWFGWYGDDFTGATDTLAVAAKAGLAARLFLQVPSAAELAEAGPLDAIGIAGAARAMDPAAMAEALAPAGRFLAEAGCRIVHYKCCSTFDSAPGTGSIGAALRALKPFCPNPLVPIVGGQPSLGRFCAFSTLFAAAGQGAEIVRIDRHPTMSRHPVTPMGEADLRRHLAEQGLRVGSVQLPAYAGTDDDLTSLLRARLADAPDGVLMDVTDDAHLARIGRLIARESETGRLLAIGPSSVVQALTAERPRPDTGARPPLGRAEGPVFVLVGSLSPVTRGQVEAARSFVRIPVDPGEVLGSPDGLAAVAGRIAAQIEAGDHAMAVTTPPGAGRLDTGRVATATARLAAEVLRAVRPARIGFAGGDTSSFATLGLGLGSLSFLSDLSPGVALCRTHAADPRLDGLELALKGGQMGPPTIFDTLVDGQP